MFASLWINCSQNVANVPPGQNVGKEIRWWQKLLISRLGANNNNEFHTRIVDINVYEPTFNRYGKVGHARCNHSNIFEPDVYKTNAKLNNLCKISLSV